MRHGALHLLRGGLGLLGADGREPAHVLRRAQRRALRAAPDVLQQLPHVRFLRILCLRAALSLFPVQCPLSSPHANPANTHSCTDVSIAGAREIAEFELDQQPEDWPYKKLPASQYGAEAAEWEGGWLKGIPSNFTTVADFLAC